MYKYYYLVGNTTSLSLLMSYEYIEVKTSLDTLGTPYKKAFASEKKKYDLATPPPPPRVDYYYYFLNRIGIFIYILITYINFQRNVTVNKKKKTELSKVNRDLHISSSRVISHAYSIICW